MNWRAISLAAGVASLIGGLASFTYGGPSWLFRPSLALGTVDPDGKNWEMEVAIPRSSIYRETPFADGFPFRLLVVRNYKRPWEQNSIGGSGSFSVRDSYARCVLSANAPTAPTWPSGVRRTTVPTRSSRSSTRTGAGSRG